MFCSKVEINQALETKSSKESQALHIYPFQIEQDQHRKKIHVASDRGGTIGLSVKKCFGMCHGFHSGPLSGTLNKK